MNLYLIGYRCTGKTSVGQRLAERLGRSFVDADEELVKKVGDTIADIVRIQGWEAFRQQEKDILKRISELENCVVATGGGAVLDSENVKHMKGSGQLVWLRASAETIKVRMLQDKHTADVRPALTANGQYDEIIDVLSKRYPYYEKAMDLSVDTDDTEVDHIADEILRKLGEMGIEGF